MAITQAQIIESMVAATLEEKKQWVYKLQRKYDRQKSSKPSTLSQNRTPSFMQTNKLSQSQQDSKLFDSTGSQADQERSLIQGRKSITIE